jgi:hypothetical protein
MKAGAPAEVKAKLGGPGIKKAELVTPSESRRCNDTD